MTALQEKITVFFRVPRKPYKQPLCLLHALAAYPSQDRVFLDALDG